MRSIVLVTAVSSIKVLAGQQIDVAICNLDNLSDAVISKARSEAGIVYLSAGVRIVWHSCDPPHDSASRASPHWFVVRFSNEKPSLPAGRTSLDIMGKAFIDGEQSGITADAYFREILTVAGERCADAAVLLGFVIAHELGHLLLGPGHSPEGLMQAAWGEKQIEALRQRRLKFSPEDAERIHLALTGGG